MQGFSGTTTYVKCLGCVFGGTEEWHEMRLFREEGALHDEFYK